jgi:hypothetical protein
MKRQFPCHAFIKQKTANKILTGLKKIMFQVLRSPGIPPLQKLYAPVISPADKQKTNSHLFFIHKQNPNKKTGLLIGHQ